MRRLLTLTLLTAAAGSLAAADWPGFRGTGNGATVEKNLPTAWTQTENVAWAVDLPGYGQSSPVTWGGTVYVTAVSGDQREKGYVVALDARTGKEKWRHTFAPTQKAAWSYTVSRAAPTPCVDADGVYCFFEGGNLVALTHAGQPRWERSLVTDYGDFKGGHGIGSSPCQTADTLFVLIDHAGPSYLLAVDKPTGKTRWKADRPSRTSWSSPVVATRDGKPEVVVSSNGSVVGYDPATGKSLWELTGLAGNTLPSASASGGVILVGAGAGRGSGDAGKSNCCLTLTADGDRPSYKVSWTAASATANYATPLAHNGCAYFVNATGVLYCLDLRSGKEHYAERLPAPCWASPIAAGDHVYFFGKDGRTAVVKAGPEFELVATNALWEQAKGAAPAAAPPAGKGKGGGGDSMDPVVYGAAVTDRALFIRTGTKLYRVGK